MNIALRFADPAAALHLDPAAPLRAFGAAHHAAPHGAARLLGGYEAADRVEALAEALAHAAAPTRPHTPRRGALPPRRCG